MATESGFIRHCLDGHSHVCLGALPNELMPSADQFNGIWNLRPEEYPTHRIHGRMVKLPRWQKAYGNDYRFSGLTSVALPVGRELVPFLSWAVQTIDHRLNGILMNWYDGSLGHYIGKHRDSRDGLIEGAPIISMSLGETRICRFRKWKGLEQVDIAVSHGSVLIIPFDTNLSWTHEITKSKRAQGRRISITIRAFH